MGAGVCVCVDRSSSRSFPPLGVYTFACLSDAQSCSAMREVAELEFSLSLSLFLRAFRGRPESSFDFRKVLLLSLR